MFRTKITERSWSYFIIIRSFNLCDVWCLGIFCFLPSDFQSACVIRSVRMALSPLWRPRELTSWNQPGILRQCPRDYRTLQKKNMKESEWEIKNCWEDWKVQRPPRPQTGQGKIMQMSLKLKKSLSSWN